MWTAANFIIEGRMQPYGRPQVVHHCSKSTPYAGGTNSCFLNQLHSIRWRYRQLLSKSTPMLVV